MAFPDDDPESKIPPEDPNLLKNRSIPQRAIVISAGVIANVIFAFSLLFTQVSLRLSGVKAADSEYSSLPGLHWAGRRSHQRPCLHPIRHNNLGFLEDLYYGPLDTCMPRHRRCARLLLSAKGCCLQVSTQGVPETFFKPGVAVPEVNRNSPAAAAGLRRGDIILKLQNIDVPGNPAAVPGVVRYITYVQPFCHAVSALLRFYTAASAAF